MGKKTFAIGDIHGHLRQFDTLLDAIQLTSNDRLILLGDYVDRGPDSAGVIDRILELSRSFDVACVMGNHEEMMLAARESTNRKSEWMKNGGAATLRSYQQHEPSIDNVLPEHWSFLENDLLPYVETETHLFVHANLHPDVPLTEQPSYMLRWESCENIVEHESGKVIVCGHTPQNSGRPMNAGYAICIDTNICHGGPLTCFDAATGRVWQAERDGRVGIAHISDF